MNLQILRILRHCPCFVFFFYLDTQSAQLFCRIKKCEIQGKKFYDRPQVKPGIVQTALGAEENRFGSPLNLIHGLLVHQSEPPPSCGELEVCTQDSRSCLPIYFCSDQPSQANLSWLGVAQLGLVLRCISGFTIASLTRQRSIAVCDFKPHLKFERIASASNMFEGLRLYWDDFSIFRNCRTALLPCCM